MAILTGTSGNDIFAGTVDVPDTAVISGLQGNTSFRYDGTRWIATGPAGTDTLNSIEQVQLNDALFTLSLGGATRVHTNTSGTQTGARMIGLANGYDIAVWTSSTGDGSGNGVFYQIFNATGERIGVETRVNTTTTSGQYEPAIALLGTGYVISWTSDSQDSSGGGVYFQRYDAAGVAQGVETRANTTVADTQNESSITALANGTFVITWQSYNQDGSSLGIYSQRFDANGAPLGSETRVNTTTTNAQADPDIVALSGGGYVVIWTSDLPSDSDVLFQLYDAGGNPIGVETAVEQMDTFSNGSGTAYAGASPAVAALPGGGFVVAWQQTGGTYTQRFDASGTRVGAQTLLHTNGADPDIAALSGGGFVVTWQTYVDSRTTLMSQLFDANGNKLGIATPVFSLAGSYQFNSAVSPLPSGGYTVNWTTGNDAYMLRFRADGTPVLPTIAGDDLPNTITAGVGDPGNPLWISGGAGNDTLTGGMAADWLDGGAGVDTLIGGLGDDTYIIDQTDRIIELADGGIDTARVTTSYTITSAYLENVTLVGTAAATLIGNNLSNVLVGNNSDNVLNGGAGADRMYGGQGNDTYFVDDGVTVFETDPLARDLIFEDVNAGIDTVVSEIDYVLGDNLENLRLVGMASNGTGNALANQLTGNFLSNILDGGAGADIMAGEAGNDIYVVDNAGDQVFELEGQGDDLIEATISWTLGANIESLSLLGNAHINGTGNELANYINGNSGNNVLDGGAGADIMNGGFGNDTYIVDNVGDVASEYYSFNLGGGIDLVRATVSHNLGNEIENLTLLGNLDIDGTGNILANVIRGNSGANILIGGGGADTLYGDYGNDTLISTDGLDRLIGGVGNDSYLVVGDTDEIVELNNQGIDTVTAAVGRTYSLGLNLENLILSGAHINGYGNSLANEITGTNGHNIIDGGAGGDRMIGGGGNDLYIVDSQLDVVVEDADNGADHVMASVTYTLQTNVEHLTLTGSAALGGAGNASSNRITGNEADNNIWGVDGNDLLIGAGGNDNLYGGNGNDVLNGGEGNDRLDGGSGTDDATYFAITGGVTIDLNITTAQNTGSAGMDTLILIERVIGSNFGNDILTGNAQSNTLWGNAGDDWLMGGAGADILYGGEGDDILMADADNDLIDGGNGIDELSFAAIAGNVAVNLGITSAQNTRVGLDTILNVENVEGSQTGNDILTGDYLNNRLRGLGGNDILAGGDGADILDGGSGSDTADYSGAWGDVIADLSTGLAQNDGSGFSDTLISIENLTGSQFDDLLTGDDGDNVLDGNLGIDILRGGLGNDTYVIDNVEDRIVENAASGTDTVNSAITYTLGADLENLTLIGTAAINGTGNGVANVLRGNAASNTLSGGAGNDHLYGGAGFDILLGGTGADSFYFDTALGGSNVERLSDFSVVDDTMHLARSIFTALSANGTLAASAFVTGAAALDADDRIIYNATTGYISYDADGNGVGAAVQFAQVTPGTALTNLDFTIY